MRKTRVVALREFSLDSAGVRLNLRIMNYGQLSALLSSQVHGSMRSIVIPATHVKTAKIKFRIQATIYMTLLTIPPRKQLVMTFSEI